MQTEIKLVNGCNPKVSKKIFHQWLIGVVIQQNEMTMENCKKAKSIAD